MTPETQETKDAQPQVPAEKAQTQVPAVPAKQPRGVERPVDQEDLIFPRARLLQPGSPEVTAQQPGQPPTNWAGQLIDSLTKDVLPMEFIPVFYTKNWIRFNPTEPTDPTFDQNFKAGDIIWRSDDALDSRVQKESKFGENGEVPLATSFLNFFSLFPGYEMPAILSFSRSSYKAGKNLLNLILRSKKDAFATKYRLSVKKNDGPNNSVYFTLEVEPVGPASAQEYTEAEKLWELYHAKPIKVDDPEHNEEADSGAQPGAEVGGSEARPY